MDISDAQLEFCTAARRGAREVTLAQLLEIFVPQEGAQSNYLTRIDRLKKLLVAIGLAVTPEIDDGDLTSRRLVFGAAGPNTTEHVRQELARDEDQTLEYKSTFTCCLNTFRANKTLEPKHYKKVDVEDSCLSAIAGMMNTEGGIVYVGVEDHKSIVGLDPDLYALQVPNNDKWALYLRSKVSTSFIDGRVVNAHLEVQFVEVNGLTVARLVVQPRTNLTFLKDYENPKGPPRLIRRGGNQTLDVTYIELEEFIERRIESRRS